MNVAFITLGCKVNSYETDAISDLFVKRGAFIVDANSEFDACIINTCSVTNQATSKSRKMIRGAIRRNPNAIIAVIGCYSQMAAKEIKNIDGVSIVLGNIDKQKVVDLVYAQLQKREFVSNVKNILNHHEFEKLSPTTFSRTRAFLKIEDGCNNFCSYCIIPYTRGPVRSKNISDIINEIKQISNNGYQEVVLTGIHTGRYQFEEYDFTKMVKKILDETNIKRLRISSIELNEITEDFLELMRDNKVLADHLHLPLQAGSNHVLGLMNRHYTREEFIEKIKLIRFYRPNISITTDIIVGFPEETDSDFIDTLALCKEIKFSKIHAFPFSLRKGTKAEELCPVADKVKDKRMKEILQLDKELQEEYNKKFINSQLEIIVEEQHGDYLVGHSSNYLPIYIPYEENLKSMMIKVKVLEYKDGKLLACYVKE